MALRVLLADESSTIKKVMQLALQDFGVEVKAVPIGVDVVQVAKSFEPDIIFADILLAKMNGYEVSKATKPAIAKPLNQDLLVLRS
jgi:CheY-like chemotaxis protein